MTSKPKFWVTCPDYVSGPYGSREVAERAAERAEKASCLYSDHTVVESAVKPTPVNSAWSDDHDDDE